MMQYNEGTNSTGGTSPAVWSNYRFHPIFTNSHLTYANPWVNEANFVSPIILNSNPGGQVLENAGTALNHSAATHFAFPSDPVNLLPSNVNTQHYPLMSPQLVYMFEWPMVQYQWYPNILPGNEVMQTAATINGTHMIFNGYAGTALYDSAAAHFAFSSDPVNLLPSNVTTQHYPLMSPQLAYMFEWPTVEYQWSPNILPGNEVMQTAATINGTHMQDQRNQANLRSLKHTECSFCRKNNEPPNQYKSHTLKDSSGKLTCPVLRAYRCPICQKTGDEAHTLSHCPQNPDKVSVACLLNQTPRNSSGKLRHQH